MTARNLLWDPTISFSLPSLTEVNIYLNYEDTRRNFAPLFTAAPNLTRLGLVWDSWVYRRVSAEDDLSGYAEALRTAAPRLRHLSMSSPPSPYRQINMASFLEACTSLVAIELDHTPLVVVWRCVKHLRCRLKVLELRNTVPVRGEIGPGVSLSRASRKILRLPATERLVRLRIDSVMSLTGPDKLTVLCEARGIELRDNRRRFTGESPLSIPLLLSPRRSR